MALQLPTTGGIRPFLQKDFQCSNYIFQGTYYKCFLTWFQISTTGLLPEVMEMTIDPEVINTKGWRGDTYFEKKNHLKMGHYIGFPAIEK